jgi:hypothetical protein
LLVLKRRFRTASHELILRRMLEFDPPVVVTIFDHGVLSFRRGNRSGRMSLTKLERECWRAVYESGEPQERFSATRSIRGWAVHEQGWKRDLLRMELLDGADNCQDADWPIDEWPADEI